VAEITSIPTREGWLYLAAVEDLYSRRVVGWSMAEHLESRLVVDALALAVERRLPGEGLLAHSELVAGVRLPGRVRTDGIKLNRAPTIRGELHLRGAGPVPDGRDGPLTEAALDLLTHRCHIPEMNGESYRLKDAKRRRTGRASRPALPAEPPAE
jgi:hypothetical protein